jgi:hypothetical protein
LTPREAELTHQLEQCQTDLVQARRENELLRQKVELLVRRGFGSRSEKLDSAQLELLQLPNASAILISLLNRRIHGFRP